jgi:hypothetical protein
MVKSWRFKPSSGVLRRGGGHRLPAFLSRSCVEAEAAQRATDTSRPQSRSRPSTRRRRNGYLKFSLLRLSLGMDDEQFSTIRDATCKTRAVGLTFDVWIWGNNNHCLAQAGKYLWQSSIGHLLLFSNRGPWNVQRRSVKQSGVGRSF